MAGLTIILSNFLYIAKYFALLWFCRTASIKLHKKMAVSILGATMTFFDTHFIGNILNRLSYDLNNIDEIIPFLFPTFASVSIYLNSYCISLVFSRHAYLNWCVWNLKILWKMLFLCTCQWMLSSCILRNNMCCLLRFPYNISLLLYNSHTYRKLFLFRIFHIW